MQIELIYFASGRNARLEENLGACLAQPVRESEDRRGFLTQLAAALTNSGTVLAVGPLSDLAEALIKGLGLPATPVDWSALGMEERAETVLPQGALPLLADGKVEGMLLESGPQAILAVDSDPDALQALYAACLAPYFQALAGETPAEAAAEEPAEEPAAQPEDLQPVDDPPEETAAPSEPAAPAEADPVMKPAAPEYDIFAGMEDVELEEPAPAPRKKRRWWIPVVCVALVLALLGGSGWYLVLRDGGHAGYYAALMQDVYGETGDPEQLGEAFSSQYLARFGGLYQINPDVIATLKADGLGLNLPVVCAAGKGDDYRFRRFDGRPALYGTPYVASPYSETDVHPNLVIRGGWLFRPLNDLLTKKPGSVKLTTDSILYGEDEWQILSVMLLDDRDEAAFDDTFAALSDRERQARVQKALSLSQVDTGVTEDELGDITLSDNFLTLLTPSTTKPGKTLAVMARRLVPKTDEILTQPDPSDPSDPSEPSEPSDPADLPAEPVE